MSKITDPVLLDSTGQEIEFALRQIAGQYDTTDYRSIVSAVRRGDANKIPNGVTFTVPHNYYGDIDFVVRRKNVDKVAGEPDRSTITIQTKYLLSRNAGSTAATFQYDRGEALAYVDTAIPAGTVVKFSIGAKSGSWLAGDYHFTATNAIAAGKKLGISNVNYDNTNLEDLDIIVYTDSKGTATEATYAIEAGDGDATVNLGTTGTELNLPGRMRYGSNNAGEANVHQFLNAIGTVSDSWDPLSKFDLMPPGYTSLAGFLGGFDEEFRSCLGLARVHDIANDIFEAPGSTATISTEYYHNAYFWLPSRKEIYGSNENAREASETQFEYFAELGTTNSDKLMYAKGATSPTSYWLRTPSAGYSHGVRYCNAGNGGGLNNYYAYFSYGLSPLAILA